MGLGLGSLFGSYCGLGQPVHPDPWILHCHSPKELVVRLGFDLCAEEKAFLSRRKQVVAKALKQVLQLDGDLQEDEVCGAGGYRCRYIAVALFQTLGSGHVGEDIGCGEASLGICSSQRAVTVWGGVGCWL